MDKVAYKDSIIKETEDSLIAQYLPNVTENAPLVRKAVSMLLEHSQGRVRSCGKPYCLHPLRTAAILYQNNMDTSAICAAILHSYEDLGITEDEIQKTLGKDAVHLASGVAKIKGLSLRASHDTLAQADAVRKMLFAMTDDVRIILIKMADRLDRIRNIRSMEPRRQRALAAEVIDIWAPLADRLGMQAEKNEFEDLSLKYSNPDVFQQIKAIVSQKKSERDAYLDHAVEKIKERSQTAGIECTIKSRAKHFYSIYQKMRKRGKEASELFDLFAVRIICSKTSECYTLLGIVHELWKPLDGRFKDYIAIPKANGYRSLHTTVMCDAGDDSSDGGSDGKSDGDNSGGNNGGGIKKPLEIQIRTTEMDALAEHGVASHWLYKKGTNRDKVDVSSLAIFNELRAWREESNNFPAEGSASSASATAETSMSVFDRLKRDLLGDEIYVFTPKGEVISLPEGSCAVDFAYRIHSSIGQTVVGAKADGKIIPLLQPLKNTQIIEVLTDPRAHPTQSWLKACRTSKARQKIHAYLVANGFMEQDAQKMRHSRHEAQETAARPDAFAASSPKYGSAYSGTAPRYAASRHSGTASASVSSAPASSASRGGEGEVVIEGERNILHCFAKCCHPQKGDAIAGFVSSKRGIVIHRADCLVYQRIPSKDKRQVKVEWA